MQLGMLFTLLVAAAIARTAGASIAQPDFTPPSHPECVCGQQVGFNCGFAVPRDQLVNKPGDLPPHEQPPCLEADLWLTPKQPVFSVIVSVYNQQGEGQGRRWQWRAMPWTGS